jgi:hypothetical protein
MDWGHLADLMHSEMSKLLQQEICSLRSLAMRIEELPRALASLETRAGPKLDRAVHEYAEHGHWPDLLPEEKTLLYYRLEFAYMTASLLATAQGHSGRHLFEDPSGNFGDGELIEWLLVGSWREEGIKLLHSTCADIVSEHAPPIEPIFGNN